MVAYCLFKRMCLVYPEKGTNEAPRAAAAAAAVAAAAAAELKSASIARRSGGMGWRRRRFVSWRSWR